MAKKAKKLTKKELETVVAKLQARTNQLTLIGQAEADKALALGKLNSLNKDLDEYQKVLEDKYGSVNIDLKDGSITPLEAPQLAAVE